MIVKCPICKKEIEINFNEQDQICGGRNEKCPNHDCGVPLWIPCESEEIVLLPGILLAN